MNSILGILIRKEFSELRRDRRVLFFSLLMPVLLYPIVLGGMDRMEQKRETEARAEALEIAVVEGDASLWSALEADSSLTLLVAEDDSLAEWVTGGDASLAVRLPEFLPAVGSTDSARIDVIYDATRDRSREARRRVESVLDEEYERQRQLRWAAAGGTGELRSLVAFATVDVASEQEASGAEASRMLIYLLLMTLFMAGSVLATDMVAGEKERGTLETLFLIPSGRALIARSKLLAVGIGTALTGVLSLSSLALSYRMGWLGKGAVAALDPQALFLVGLLAVPLAVLLGAILLAVSAYARSLKEAQYYVLPVMLLVFVPALMSMSQAIELSPLVAILPVANMAFAMRDVLGGHAEASMLVLAVVSTLGWILLLSRRVADLLSNEEAVLGFDPEPFFARTPGGRDRALNLGMALTVLIYFYAGQWLQAKDLRWGLFTSLWILLPLLGVGTWALVRSPVRIGELLSLRWPDGRAWFGALALGWGLMLPVAGGLQRLVGTVLPMPEGQAEPMADALGAFSSLELVGLVALSPAICEEFVFRGVFLGLLLRQGTARRAILLSSLYFALIHLSIFRLAPTFLLGVVLASLVVRHRSLWPACLMHFVYNGSLLLGAQWFETREAPFAFDGPQAWGISVLLLVLGGWLAFGAKARGAERSNS